MLGAEIPRAEDANAVQRRTLEFLSRHGLRVRAMESGELAEVISADGSIYSTASPVHLDTARQVQPGAALLQCRPLNCSNGQFSNGIWARPAVPCLEPPRKDADPRADPCCAFLLNATNGSGSPRFRNGAS